MSRQTIKELEERLKLKDGENERLRRNIRLKDSELRELQETCNFKSEKAIELERKYGVANSEVKQLKTIVESRFPDEVEQGLMEKTLLCAEATHQVDRLQEKLKKSKTDNLELREERQELKKKTQALSQKLHKAIGSYERLKKERNMNNKVFLELDDIVTALNNIRIDSDFTVEDENDNVSMRNMRRKIQAIEDDRQRLSKDCKNLKEENAFKDAKIQSLESKYYDPKKSSRTSPPPPPSFRSRRISTIERDDRSVSSSDSSTIEPPNVSLEVYEETKKEYEIALRDMIKLTEELTATKASVKGYEKSSNETEERFKELSDEYKDALLEMSNLRRDFQKAEAKSNEALLVNEEMKHVYETRLSEMTESYEFLEENFNKLKDEQNEKLVRLENEVSNSERFFEEECKRLKEEHKLELQTLTKDLDELKREHEQKVGKERRRYEDLRIEHETVRDQLRGDTEALERLKEKYNKSLKRIVQLEDSLGREKENGERALLRSTEEALMRYQKLKTDYNALLAAKKSTGNSESNYLRQMEGQCAALHEKLRQAQTDADIRYKELRGSYESALSTIDSLEKKLEEMEERPNGEVEKTEETEEEKGRSKYELAFDKISDLERELVSGNRILAPMNVAPQGDEAIDGALAENSDTTANNDSQSMSHSGLQHFCDFLQHQRNLRSVHYGILFRVKMTEENVTQSPPSRFFGSMFLDEDLDIDDFKTPVDGNNSNDVSKSTISKLLNQLAKIKLQAVAARIRNQTREKEFKLVFLQYKSILEEYNSTKAKSFKLRVVEGLKADLNKTSGTEDSNSNSNDEPADPPGESAVVHEDETDTSEGPVKVALHVETQDETAIAAKIAELEENVKVAETKVRQATSEIQETKQKAEEAEREQRKQELYLRTMLAKHKELETEMAMVSGNDSDKNGVAEKNQAPLSPETSFDGGFVMLGSCASSVSAEARDEKTYSPKIQKLPTEHDKSTNYFKLKQEYNAAVNKISSIELELRHKKEEADLTKSKLEAREEELKGVIQRYKELHTEYGGFLDGTSSVSQAKVIQERDAAKWRISEMEIELRQAKESAATASAKQNLAKQHLRDVIFQYKTLQREHASLVQRIEGLRVGLPTTTGLSAIKTHPVRRVQIQEEKRDFAMPMNNVEYHSARAADDCSQVSHQTGQYRDDTQSIVTYNTSKSQSSKKKGFMKEIYKEVKLSIKKKTAVPPHRRIKGKEVKQIQGL